MARGIKQVLARAKSSPAHKPDKEAKGFKSIIGKVTSGYKPKA